MQFLFCNSYTYSFQNIGTNQLARRGLFSGLFSHRLNWTNVLNNTQKTLNVINQAIPIVYQVKPVVNNMRSVFKIANALNTPTSTNINNSNNRKENKNTVSNNPVFYL